MAPADYIPKHFLHHLIFWSNECLSDVAIAPQGSTIDDLKRLIWEGYARLQEYGKGLSYKDLRIWKLNEQVSCYPLEDAFQRCEAVATSGNATGPLSPQAKLSRYWPLSHSTSKYLDLHVRFSSEAARKAGKWLRLDEPFDIPEFWPSNTDFPPSPFGPAFRLEYDTIWMTPRTRVAYLTPHSDSAYPPDGVEKPVMVKFCTQYNVEAHQLLARERLAPAIHFFGSLHPYTKFFFVVMECVYPPQGHASLTTLPTIQADVAQCVETLHAADLVHGDIRIDNILLYRPEAVSDETIYCGDIRAMLVDFDWAGREGEATYPRNINMLTVSWPAGVKPGSLITKEHDTTMLKWIDWNEVLEKIQLGSEEDGDEEVLTSISSPPRA